MAIIVSDKSEDSEWSLFIAQENSASTDVSDTSQDSEWSLSIAEENSASTDVVNENDNQGHGSDTSEDSERSLSIAEKNSASTDDLVQEKRMRISQSFEEYIIWEPLVGALRMRPYFQTLDHNDLNDNNNHFIDRQSSNLIRKVTRVNPILNDLMRYTPLTYIQYGHIQRQSTNQEKMEALYNIVKYWSKNEKDDVYEILKQYDGELIRELQQQDKAPDKNHFINRHRSQIIAKSSAANAILDDLFLMSKLKLKQYNNIRSKPTNQEKIKELYSFVEDWSEGDKDILCELLKEHNGELIRELENEDKRPPSIQWEHNHFNDRQLSKLIRNITRVNPILAGLLLHAWLTPDQCMYIQSQPTNQEKMQDWNDADKDVMYVLLKQHNGEPIQELQNQQCLSSLPHERNPVMLNAEHNSLSLLIMHEQYDNMESKTSNQEKKIESPDWWRKVPDWSFYLPEKPDVEKRQAEANGIGHYWTLMYSHLKNHFTEVNKAMSTRNKLGTIFFPIIVCALAGLPAASCETHRLWYSQTGILQADKYPPQFTFQTAGFVDDEQIDKYSHLTRRDEPVASWMERHEDEGYWHQETMSRIGWEKVFKDNLQILSLRINETLNPVTLQHFYACELGEDGSHRGYYQYGLNGKEFLHLDEDSMRWIPAMHEAQISADRWNRDPSIAEDVKHYLDERCPEALKKYMGFMKQDHPSKNVPPEVKVWGHKAEKQTTLHCLVYGFYPRAVDVKWVRNGVDHILSHQMSPILPHPDGTYQIRVNVEVPTNEEDSYSCLVDHRTLEEPVSVIWEPNIPEMERTWIIIVVSVTIFNFMVISLGILIGYKRSRLPKKFQSVMTVRDSLIEPQKTDMGKGGVTTQMLNCRSDQQNWLLHAPAHQKIAEKNASEKEMAQCLNE